jgi:hypothetical protein
MSPRVGVVGEKWVLIKLPMVFVLTDEAACKKAFDDWEWLVSVHVITDRKVLHSAGVGPARICADAMCPTSNARAWQKWGIIRNRKTFLIIPTMVI